jgi:hypothetical protein
VVLRLREARHSVESEHSRGGTADADDGLKMRQAIAGAQLVQHADIVAGLELARGDEC